MRKSFFLSLIFFAISMVAFAQASPQGSPCPDFARPFCTDENPYGIQFDAGTQGQASAFLGNSTYSCCTSTPNPSWYYMQIASPGNLVIYLSGAGLDIDFICWGPFEAQNQADFVNKLCNHTFTLNNLKSSCSIDGSFIGSHRPENGNHTNDTGGYPVGNVIDCSYSAQSTEWCYIPNAQTGEWYLLLMTNYSNQEGEFSFSPMSTTPPPIATTNCNLLNTADCNSPICEGQTLQLICTAPHDGATYNWTLPGTTYSHSTTNEVLEIPNATPDMSGEWHMTMSGISQSSNEALVSVVVNATPTPVMTSSDNFAVCAGDSVHLAVHNPESGAIYKWSVRPIGGDYAMFAQNVNSVAYPTTDEDLQFVLIQTQNECTGVNEHIVTVNSIPVIGITVDKTQLCYGESNNMTATGGTQYQWSTGATTASINVTPLATTDYSVNVKTAAQCEADTAFTIKVNPEIIFDYETSPSYCEKPTGTIEMQMTGGAGDYTFSCPTATFTDSLAEHLLAGTYTVTATDMIGCTKTQNIEVDHVPGPTACFVFASSDDVHMSITNCTTGGNNNSYFWDFGDAVTSVDVNPEHEYADPGRYTVSMLVVDENQCMDSLKQDYLINGPVYFPNAFTPNGDGLNDIMRVVGRTIQVEDFLWVVYDRRGTQAFVSINPELGWDGKLSDGKPAPAGVYVYYLKYKDVNGNKFEKEGSFTLIR